MNYLIQCDVDGVLADLVDTVLWLYNADYKDTLKVSDIRAWDMSQFVKPECGKKIYDYFWRKDLYEFVKPIEGAVEGVAKLREAGHRVVFLTAGVWSAAEKFNWLQVLGFNPGKDAEDFICAYDKALVKGDVLIDDRIDNCVNFYSSAILVSQPWNMAYEPTKRIRRADGWEGILEKFLL